MKNLFAVTLVKGEGWNENKPMRSQEKWIEHAAFMDELAADGFVVLGGPLSDGEDEAPLAVNAGNEREVRSVFERDSQIHLQIREIEAIRKWIILLEAERS